MSGTLLLSLAFSAFFLWVLKATYLHPDDAKELGYTHKGKFSGCNYYCTLPDENGEMTLAGANIVSDSVIPPIMTSIMQAQGKGFTMDLEEL